MHEMPNFAAQERTLLRIEPIGVAPWSVRGVRQTLSPLPGETHRTVNGKLVNFTPIQFRLFRSTIAGRDLDVPAINNVWPGDVVTVHCVHELRYRADTDFAPIRPVVPGSLREEDGFFYYRPILTCMFTGPAWTSELAEWAGEAGWSFELEEVGGV